ncbi:MAG: methyltransferase [Parcubacteria group bacterium Licking1014_1]|nr:MAG: methyltransferase [Parcubacteria group bacterium Licking1014_1]
MNTNQWNNIFKKEGKVYFKPQEDMSAMVKLFKKRGIKKVLDLGCGSGRHVVYFAKNGFETYGIDIAPVGLKMTKDWLKQEKFKANLKLCPIFKKLPYKSNFFGAIIAVQVVSHEKIENIRKLIKEMDRILKPNGLIFVAFNQRSKVKDWRVGSIQKERFIGDDGVSMFEERRKIIGPRTHVPIEGTEKGLIHYAFDKTAIRKEFQNFKIHRISLDSKKCRYILLTESKKIK